MGLYPAGSALALGIQAQPPGRLREDPVEADHEPDRHVVHAEYRPRLLAGIEDAALVGEQLDLPVGSPDAVGADERGRVVDPLAVAFGQALEPWMANGFSIVWGVFFYLLSLTITSRILRRRMPEVVNWVQTV